jgi:hypothetical protein
MEVRLDRLVGRPVLARHGHRIGRLEECRARREGAGWIVSHYVIGAAGLLERLHLGARLLIGVRRRGYVASWEQLIVTRDGELRLTCPLDELECL